MPKPASADTVADTDAVPPGTERTPMFATIWAAGPATAFAGQSSTPVLGEGEAQQVLRMSLSLKPGRFWLWLALSA